MTGKFSPLAFRHAPRPKWSSAFAREKIRLMAMCACVAFPFPLTAADSEAKPPDPLPLILDMVHHNPGETRYSSKFNDPATLAGMGYNGKVYFLFDSPLLAVDWDDVDPTICPKGSAYRKWVDEKTAFLKERFKACEKAGIKTYAMSDFILLPKTLVDKENMRAVMGNPRNPKTEKYIRLALRQAFAKFKRLDGIVVRVGETYLQDAPYFFGKIQNKRSPEKTIAPLMKILRDEVCVKLGKTVIFRSWLSFDTSIKTYMAVSNAVEPHKNLYISVKHCEGDFHRTNPFSRVLGIGRHKQIVEVQCAREYEGKGAYPNYIAKGVIEGFEEHAGSDNSTCHSIRNAWKSGKLFGVWTWSRGGGWGGPYIKNEMWCDLNAWVMARWAANPAKSEKEIFGEYATKILGLDPQSAKKLRKLAILSAKAVLRGVNSTRGDMNPWWTRDAGIGWPRYRQNPDMDRNLKEKDESVEIWRKIVQLANEIKWRDAATAEAAKASCLYGLRLYEIFRAIVHIDYADKKKNAAAVKKWIAEYDRAWQEYKKLPQAYPNTLATLYDKKYRRHITNPADIVVEKLRIKYNVIHGE